MRQSDTESVQVYGDITMSLDQKFITMNISPVEYGGIPLAVHGEWKVDSRQITAGDCFVALSGVNHDGHDFIADACARGAVAVMMARSRCDSFAEVMRAYDAKCTWIMVDDPRTALIALAAAWRKQFTYPVIGITGSMGKTTTKEMLSRIFTVQGSLHIASRGNQNTILGAALTLLRMRAEHAYAIVEMGISARGEMEQLAMLVQPDTAVITAIGHSHMEGLGSIADIAAEKRVIFKYLKYNGVGFINGDQSLLLVAYHHPVIKFGCKTVNQIQARQIQQDSQGISFYLKLYRDRYHVRVASENRARVYNALAAAAVAHYYGVPASIILQSISSTTTVESRFQHRPIGITGSVIIDDSYNASPESMKSALLAFEHLEGPGKKVAVLGDMLELGVNAPFWHRQLGRFLRRIPSLSHVVFVGDTIRWATKTVPYGLSYEVVPDWRAATVAVSKILSENRATVLVKASHGVGLSNVVESLVSK